MRIENGVCLLRGEFDKLEIVDVTNPEDFSKIAPEHLQFL